MSNVEATTSVLAKKPSCSAMQCCSSQTITNEDKGPSNVDILKMDLFLKQQPRTSISEEKEPVENSFPPPNTSELSIFSSLSFTSCKSCTYLRRALQLRENHISNHSIDTLHNSESPMGSSADGGGNGDADNSMQYVLRRQHIQFTDDEVSERDEIINMGDIYQKFRGHFTPDEIDVALEYFMQFDFDADGLIILNELKLMLEKLGVPQTHLTVRRLMAQVVGEQDEYMSFFQFLLIYAEVRKLPLTGVKNKDDAIDPHQLAQADAVDVSAVGVMGAKNFFEAKIALQQPKELQALTNQGSNKASTSSKSDELTSEQYRQTAPPVLKRWNLGTDADVSKL